MVKDKWSNCVQVKLIPHDCPFGVGVPYCIYHDHDDELCLRCLIDFRKQLNHFIKDLRKDGDINEEKAHDKK